MTCEIKFDKDQFLRRVKDCQSIQDLVPGIICHFEEFRRYPNRHLHVGIHSVERFTIYLHRDHAHHAGDVMVVAESLYLNLEYRIIDNSEIVILEAA
jgi:hypothetical protein